MAHSLGVRSLDLSPGESIGAVSTGEASETPSRNDGMARFRGFLRAHKTRPTREPHPSRFPDRPTAVPSMCARVTSWTNHPCLAQGAACQPASTHKRPLTAGFFNRKTISSAISRGSINRRNCVHGKTCSVMIFSPSARAIGVPVNPGWMIVHRMQYARDLADGQSCTVIVEDER